jgi:hypothetical protein
MGLKTQSRSERRRESLRQGFHCREHGSGTPSFTLFYPIYRKACGSL